MRRIGVLVLVVIFTVPGLFPVAAYSEKKRDHVRYEKYYHDPILKLMREEMDSLRAVSDSITSQIKGDWKKRKKREREEREIIRFDFEGIVKPESPKDFKAPFHFPPVPQYLTGTCWCFCTTSFIESEIKRLTGKEIKLSEMYTVYWEYVDKARGYIRKRGNQPLAQGSESDAVFIVWKDHGVVPADVYKGLVGGSQRHNHKELAAEISNYLEFVDEHGYWDEEANIAHIRKILDRHLGRPPEKFEYGGRTITPKQFLDEVLELNLDDYIQFMSTLSVPFYTQGEFKVPDNWRPTSTYYNIPLDEFYECIELAARKGYTVCIGGDISEPGYSGFEDAAIVPTFDIPQEYIDQDSREFRFFNKTTEDDHGVHLLAYKKVGGRDWFLIKDSSRSSRHGKHKGYYFYRDDYIKLKMLTYMVHRDVVQHLMPRFKE